jgi:hypothetical protein
MFDAKLRTLALEDSEIQECTRDRGEQGQWQPDD